MSRLVLRISSHFLCSANAASSTDTTEMNSRLCAARAPTSEHRGHFGGGHSSNRSLYFVVMPEAVVMVTASCLESLGILGLLLPLSSELGCHCCPSFFLTNFFSNLHTTVVHSAEGGRLELSFGSVVCDRV